MMKRPLSELAQLASASIGPAVRLLFQPTTFQQLPRIFDEGIDPAVHLLIQANNTAIINRWLNNGTTVAFLSSFPRSGNTWLRYLLSDVLLQMHNVQTETQLSTHPNDIISYFNGHLIARRQNRCPWGSNPPAAFVKTHGLFGQIGEILAANPWKHSANRTRYRDCRAIYIYRSPEDALVSLYHLAGRHTHSRKTARYDIDTFCAKEVSGWMDNVSSYLAAADTGFPIFYVAYERLLENPAKILSDALKWVGLKHDFQMAERAVSNMRFEKLKALEMQKEKTDSTGGDQKHFFRRGRIGSGLLELKESIVQEIQDRTASLRNELNQRSLRQPAEYPLPVEASPLQNGDQGVAAINSCLQQI